MKYAALLLALAVALPVAADEIVLRNGSRIEGRVVAAGSEVTVVMDIGTVTFKRSEVSRIVLGPSTLQDFDEKLKQLKPDDVDGRFRLALWARQRELENRAKALFQECLLINPDHDGARGELGYRKHEGRWVTEDELRAAQGLVKFRGAWIKKTEAEEILRREADTNVSLGLQQELVLAQKEILRAEADYLRAKAETERLRAGIEENLQRALPRYQPVVVYHYHVLAGRKVPCCCTKCP